MLFRGVICNIDIASDDRYRAVVLWCERQHLDAEAVDGGRCLSNSEAPSVRKNTGIRYP
jgi:hypothetical protein